MSAGAVGAGSGEDCRTENEDVRECGGFLRTRGCHGFSSVCGGCGSGSGGWALVVVVVEESESVASQLSQTGRWLSCGRVLRRRKSAGVLVRDAGGGGGKVIPMPSTAFIFLLGRRMRSGGGGRELKGWAVVHSDFGGEVGDWWWGGGNVLVEMERWRKRKKVDYGKDRP